MFFYNDAERALKLARLGPSLIAQLNYHKGEICFGIKSESIITMQIKLTPQKLPARRNYGVCLMYKLKILPNQNIALKRSLIWKLMPILIDFK